jgi:DNA-directed RNA polymerase subunit omega
MARITVEDCLEKIDSQYDLVLIAKERTAQLTSGDKPLVPEDNDKNTVISLREIGEGKISIKTLEDSAINKLRKSHTEPVEMDDIDVEQEDDFDKIYKGEISKSGAAILPSKRVRKIPEKIAVGAIEKNTEDKIDENSKKLDQDNKKDSLPVEEKN